jgi:hypothetical protein
MHTAELLVPDPSPFEFETAITKFKRYKTPGSDQIPAELIQVPVRPSVHPSIHASIYLSI